MIRRLYVHNFRCLENFELPVAGLSSVLLIGNNGSGKSTVGLALEILQKIARGTNRVGELVKPKDFARNRAGVPMRFEIEVDLNSTTYLYTIAFELPAGFKELRVMEERLLVGGTPIFTRQKAQVRLARNTEFDQKEAEFGIDWHLAALPLIQESSRLVPLFLFKQWLARLLILRPIPSKIEGRSDNETLQPDPELVQLGQWFQGLQTSKPAAYSKIAAFLVQVMPDFQDIQNPVDGEPYRSLHVQFATGEGSLTVPFGDLSDGEKCFLICAVVLAANDAYGPLVCYWDEPDNFLALAEVGHFLIALRKGFKSGGQFIATSHNPEAIRSFSDENTLLLHRKSHIEPSIVRPLSEIERSGDLVGALIRGDLEP